MKTTVSYKGYGTMPINFSEDAQTSSMMSPTSSANHIGQIYNNRERPGQKSKRTAAESSSVGQSSFLPSVVNNRQGGVAQQDPSFQSTDADVRVGDDTNCTTD